MPSAKVKEVLNIEVGEHEGTIVRNVVATPQGYEYHETFIKVDDVKGNPELKVGLPFVISEQSGLGQLLQTFGAKLEANEDLNTDDYLKPNMKVLFSITKKKKDDREFSVIVADTLRPA